VRSSTSVTATTSGAEPPWAVHLPPGMDPADLDLEEGGSLPGAWRQRWDAAPHARAVHTEDTGWVTYERLERDSRTAAACLAARGVGPRTRVLLAASSSYPQLTVYVAVLRLGATVIPANPANPPAELETIVAATGPQLAVADAADVLGEAAGPTVSTAVLEELTGETPARAAAPVLDDVAPDEVALICLTSGTSGNRKAVPLQHQQLLASAHATRLAWGWSAEDELILTLPLYHLHGLGVGVNGTLTAGAALRLQPRFDPEDVAAQARSGASMFFGVPTMYTRLAEQRSDLSDLRLCVSGSAPLPADVWERVRTDCGQEVLERYGMTETVLLASNPLHGERRPGTVGPPLPGVELRCSDDGEVLARGPNVFDGYLAGEGPDAEGWFATGDLGEFDGDGYLRIVGRTKELIISGGQNVHPREVAETLERHPAITEAAVVGEPHPEWGEQVVAYVVGEHRECDTVRTWLREQLAAYKQPKQFRYVDALPRNAMGKIVPTQLADLVSHEAGLRD
jgi:malonyl-CoA/methylmalonyl-CoA synthetase